MLLDQAARILSILQAGTETYEGRARALHAVIYARELHDTRALLGTFMDHPSIVSHVADGFAVWIL